MKDEHQEHHFDDDGGTNHTEECHACGFPLSLCACVRLPFEIDSDPGDEDAQ